MRWNLYWIHSTRGVKCLFPIFLPLLHFYRSFQLKKLETYLFLFQNERYLENGSFVAVFKCYKFLFLEFLFAIIWKFKLQISWILNVILEISAIYLLENHYPNGGFIRWTFWSIFPLNFDSILADFRSSTLCQF